MSEQGKGLRKYVLDPTYVILDPNPELTAALRKRITLAQQAEWARQALATGEHGTWEGMTFTEEERVAIEEPTPKPRSVVEDFEFIRARVQEIKANKQTWWCSQCTAHRTQGCSDVACPQRLEDYCCD